MLQAYGECLDKITMSSPTYINEIIAAASKHAVKLYPIVRRSNSTTAPGMGRGKGTKNRKKHSPTGDAGDGDGNGDGSDSDDDGDDNEGSGEHSDVDEHVRPCYTVLLVLVDNVIDDFVQTMRQIELSSFDPISIVVIGVGKANFSAMEPLNQSVANNAEGGDASSSSSSSGGSTGRDSEGKHHGHNSSTKRRDIIQFLRYRDHAANDTRRGSKGDAGSDSSRSSNAGDVEGQASGIDELARLALAKVPSQFLSFVRSHGIEPPPILPHLSIEVPRVYDVPMPCYTVGNTRVDDAGELYLVCRVYDDEDEIVYEYKQPHQTNSSDDDSDGEDGEGEESDDEDAGGEIIRDWVSINQLRPSDRSGGTSDNDANADGDGDTGDAIVSRKDRKKAQRKNAELLRESERVHCKTRHFIVECERGDKADAGKDMTELLLGKNKSKLNKKKRKMRKKQKGDEEGRLDRISDWSSLSYVEISLWRRVFRAQKKTSSKRNSKTTTRKMSRRKSKKMKNKDKDAEPDSDSEVDSDNDDNLASGDDSKDSMLVSNPDDLVSLTKIDLVDVDDNDSEGAGRHELTLPFDDEVVCGSVKARIHFSSGGQLLPVVLKRQRKASVSKQKEHARYRAKAERKRAKREKEEMAEADKEMTTIMKEVDLSVDVSIFTYV